MDVKRKPIIGRIEGERKAQDIYEHFFFNSIDMLCIADQKGYFKMLNPEWEKVLGYTKEELMGKPFVSFVHPDDVQSTIDATKELSNSVIINKFTNRYKHKDGSYKWIEWRSYPVDNMIYAIARDITDRKKAEEDLAQSEKKYRLLFENMTSGFALHEMIYDENGKPVDYRYLEANPAFEKLTGLSAKYMIGKTIKEIVPNIEEHWIQTFGNVAMTGIPMSYMNYARDLGNKCFDTYVFSPEKDKYAVVFNDVTDRVIAMQSLKESQATLLKAQTLGHIGYSMQFVGDSKIWTSAEGMRIYGFPQEDSYQSIESITACIVDLPFFLNEYHSALEHGRRFDLEFEIKPADASPVRIIHAISEIEKDIDKGISKVISVFQDITARKKAEEEIKKLNTELEKRVNERTEQLLQLNKDLEAFAYSISHDLRAPLRHIDGFTGLLTSRIKDMDEEVTNYCEKIKIASKRMSSMIDDLLAFSRLGQKKLEMSVVNLNTLIQEIVDQFKSVVKSRNIKWIVNNLPEVHGDKNLLRIVFENLISNSVKYTSRKEEALIEIGYENERDGKYTIFIRDNGAGFDMKYVDKLFNVFQRLHSNEEFEGTGIGLANVKRIITKHSGFIRAEGKINEGATFYIILLK